MKNYAVMVSVGLLGICACGSEAGTSTNTSEPGSEAIGTEIGKVQEELFDDTCWRVAPADATISITPGQLFGQTKTSPNASYGRPGCPNQYIVDVVGTLGREIWVQANPAGQMLSSSTWCAGYWGMAKMRGTPAGVVCPTMAPCGLRDIDYWKQTGQMVPNPAVPNAAPVCGYNVTEGFYRGYYPSNHGFNMIRIVTTGGFGMGYTPVEVSIYSRFPLG
jgi:hypothetical protein